MVLLCSPTCLLEWANGEACSREDAWPAFLAGVRGSATKLIDIGYIPCILSTCRSNFCWRCWMKAGLSVSLPLSVCASNVSSQQHGAAEARRAHNPEVPRSKRGVAIYFFFSCLRPAPPPPTHRRGAQSLPYTTYCSKTRCASSSSSLTTSPGLSITLNPSSSTSIS